MGKNLKITTPRGAVIQTTAGTARLEWAGSFGPDAVHRFTQAQKFIDSEVLRFCSVRVPFQTGMLQTSGILGTVVGSGEVWYTAPYAARQNETAHTRPYDANRGGQWFERGKAAERRRILEGARKLAGGK